MDAIKKDEPEKLAYSCETTARLLGLSVGTVYTLIREQRIPAIRVSVRRLIVPKAALEAYLAQSQVKAVAER